MEGSGTAHGADLAALAAAGIEEVGAVGLEPAHARARGHLEAFEDGAALGIDATDLALVAFPRAVPQLAVDPRHAGHEAVRFDRAQHRARRRVDAVDLAIAVLPDPQASLGPGEARVAAAARRGNRGDDVAAGGIDLVDPGLGDLPEVLAVERGAGVAGARQRPGHLAALGIERDQLRAAGDPHAVAVVADAGHLVGAGEGAVLANDLGGSRRRACLGPGGLAGLLCEGHLLAPFGTSMRCRQSKSTRPAAQQGVTRSS